jgi:hypothetical protein
MARTYGYALAGALIATFTITPVLASFVLPDHVEEVETAIVRFLRRAYEPVLAWALDNRKVMVGIGAVFLIAVGLIGSRLGSEFLPALEEGNYWIVHRCRRPPRWMRAPRRPGRCARYCCGTRRSSPWFRNMAARTMAAMRPPSPMWNSSRR